jgi:tetratricopeptide (TPR) repeat protein
LSARWRFALAALAAALAAGCGPSRQDLVPLPAVATGDLEPSVRAAVARAQRQFDAVAQGKPSDKALADAYGELGLVFQAQSLAPPAEAAYRDARLLAPHDARWPYLLGHLYNDTSRVPEAISSFEAALAIDGRDSPTLLSLGEVYLQHGDFDKARAMYARLGESKDAQAASLAGLGKVAFATHRYQEAIDDLEQALKLSPASSHLRQPLAMAYRELGDNEKAEENLKLVSRSGAEPGVADPMADALDARVAATAALVRRGKRMGQAGRFDLAEPAFRAAVEGAPENADARANLGISLANLGRNEEAQRELTRALELDPASALAHLSLAVVDDRLGPDEAAVREYRQAIARDPKSVQALVYLGDALMRAGRAAEAASCYERAVALQGDALRIRLSLAMAQVKAGRDREAAGTLEAANRSVPGDPEVVNALARLLATAPPESGARDATRALSLSKALFESAHDPNVGQTYAMALASSGRFDEAVKLQRETIIVFEHSSAGAALKPFLERNLARYERHTASREGWPPDDPLWMPRSPAAQRATAPSS